MVFDGIDFIKPNRGLNKDFDGINYSPMFRRKFKIENVKNTKLYVCGLGYGYYYINGKPVSADLFTAPVSDYTKTLWYNVYDVTEILHEGENVIAVWCGNGWYNEEFKTSWNYNEAAWRDVPKFILNMKADGESILQSDTDWKCTTDGPIWFNALRSGEYFDSRKYDKSWTEADFDDSEWESAIIDKTPPSGKFRECRCEPIHEFESYKPIQIKKSDDNKFIFDFGQNISGYVRIKAKGESGQLLKIRYAEQINDDLTLQLNKMYEHYHESEFQTDRLILCGKEIVWSPKFCYHGFRYVEVEGISNADEIEICSVFVHQAVEKRTEFECSDKLLNDMFKAGCYSVWSNMFYMLTDCPTREKLGWANDAQSSAEQILTDFKAEKLFDKWLYDVCDAMRDDGALPGIIPTSGWGFEWGNGPVSDGLIFELPYKIYMHSGNAEPLIRSIDYFDKYFEYIKTRTDSDGFVRFGLSDWNGDFERQQIPVEFINALLFCHFYEIAALAAELKGTASKEYKQSGEKQKKLVKDTYIGSDGKCVINQQTAVAMLIYYEAYDELEPLKKQLTELVEMADFHNDCGMVGIRRLLLALNKCGLYEYAYKVLTVKGLPGYREWFEQSATTLWEIWDWTKHSDSKNHHMYSDFMSWLVKTAAGINSIEPGFNKVEIKPYFFKDLDYVKCICDTAAGKISVFWKKSGENVTLEINVPETAEVYYKNKKLNIGINALKINGGI